MSDLVLYLRNLRACEEAIAWAGAYTDPAVAWAECPRGDWMLWLLAKTGADHRTLVLAACDCARLALVYVPEGEARPRRALEVTEAWARGAATTIEEVRIARADAYAAYADAYASAYASAAYAADAAAYAAAYAAYAAYAAAYADAAADPRYAAAAAAASAMPARCAAAVRARFPVPPGLLDDLRERAGGERE